MLIPESNPQAGQISLIGIEAVEDVILNQPTNNVISNYTVSNADATTSNLNEVLAQHNNTLYFMGEKRSSRAVDYQARTLGMATQCQIITLEC